MAKPEECICGGMMHTQIKKNRQNKKMESWYVCPFCHSQHPVADTQAAGTDGDQILTQPASHP